MEFVLSQHAKAEIAHRGIPLDVVEKVLGNPAQIVPEHGGMEVFQSRHNFGDKIFLVRIVVDRKVDPAMVVTVYRTSKIEKYWRKP
ncbi:MAG: DUF4258 domain-containing protein [Terriglobia bacterium]